MDHKLIAKYMEAGWGDFLAADSGSMTEKPFHGFGARTIPFYKSILKIVSSYASMPKLILDVGSASGRTTYELGAMFPKAEIIGCEPSTDLFHAAKQMIEKYDLKKVTNVTFLNQRVEDIAYTEGSFDLILCLNVIDRHTHPAKLLTRLSRLLAPGAFLCCASPFEWKDSITCEAERIENFRDFFHSDYWQIEVEKDIDYVMRVNKRIVVNYLTNVIIVQKKV